MQDAAVLPLLQQASLEVSIKSRMRRRNGNAMRIRALQVLRAGPALVSGFDDDRAGVI
jgi:hypothetical protein